MPDLPLNSTRWRYSVDLDFSPIGRWAADFVEQADPATITENVFALATTGDTVTITSVIDGHQTAIVDKGIVDRYSVEEEADGVFGVLEGRDSKARWLDAYPTSAVTYRGMYVSEESELCVRLHYPSSFHSVAQAIAQAAGLTLIIGGGVYNYSLGQDFVHETTMSYMEALSALADPLRQATQGRVDFVIRGNHLIMQSRQTTSPTVSIPYSEVTTRRPSKTRRPTINDVQVLGATFQIFVPKNIVIDEIIIGEDSVDVIEKPPIRTPYTESRTIQCRLDPSVVSRFAGEPHSGSRGYLLWEETETKWFDKNGLHLSSAARRTWYYGIRTEADWDRERVVVFRKNRTEDSSETIAYEGPDGQLTSRRRSVFVHENTIIPATGWTGGWRTWIYINQEMERELSTYTYRPIPYPPEGTEQIPSELTYQITTLYRAKEPTQVQLSEVDVPWSPWVPEPEKTALTLAHIESIDFIQSGNQLIRVLKTTDIGPNGEVTTSTASEVSFGVLKTPTPQDRDQPAGTRTEQVQVKAGPDNANIKISLPLLGTQANCEYVRQQIKTWYNSWEIEVDLEMVPNLNVAEGSVVQITSAPARWPQTIFYLPTNEIVRDPDTMTQTVRGITWAALS